MTTNQSFLEKEIKTIKVDAETAAEYAETLHELEASRLNLATEPYALGGFIHKYSPELNEHLKQETEVNFFRACRGVSPLPWWEILEASNKKVRTQREQKIKHQDSSFEKNKPHLTKQFHQEFPTIYPDFNKEIQDGYDIDFI